MEARLALVECCGPPCRTRRCLRRRTTAPGVSVPDWEVFVGEAEDEKLNELLRAHASTGRPLGTDHFVESLEQRLARSLKRKKPGPKTHETNPYLGDLFGEEGRN